MLVPKSREPSLDALRGIAALFVLISHATIVGLYQVEPFWGMLKWTPLKIFWSGHQAVILFFVISGFSLTRLWQSISPKRLDAYLISRCMRLFPPYMASTILALAIYQCVSLIVEWNKGWMNLPKPTFSVQALVDHCLMIGHFDTSEINPPIWSIVHEMRISIGFPVIYFLVYRFGGVAVSGFYISSALIAWALLGNLELRSLKADLMLTLHYSTFFAVGAFLALHQDKFSGSIKNLVGHQREGLWFFAVMLYAYPFDNPWGPGYRVLGDLAIGFGSALIICLILAARPAAFGGAGCFLGKISYSLYLNHILVLNLSLLLLFGAVKAPLIWMATIAGSVLLAILMYRLVEQPSIALARYLRMKMQELTCY